MSVIIPYLYIVFISTSLSVYLKKSMAFSIPISLIGISILIMVFGYFGDTRVSIYFAIVFSVFIIFKNRKFISLDSIKIFINSNFIPLFCFAVLFLYLSFYHKDSAFWVWDEFSHWGPMVKGMFENNKLYPYLDINNAHRTYPPLFQNIEYLFNYLSGAYTEISTYRGFSIFCASLFLPILDLFSNKSKIRKLIYTLLFLFIVIFINSINFPLLDTYLDSIYKDYSLGILSAVTIYLVISLEFKSKSNHILVASYLSALLLSKEFGFAFYLMVLFVLFFCLFIKSDKKTNMINLVFFVVIPLLLFMSWKIYTKDISGEQFSLSNIDINNIYNVLFNNMGYDYQLITKDNFFYAINSYAIVYNYGFIRCCVVSLLVLIPLSFISFKDTISKAFTIIIAYIIGYIGFSLTMLIAYLTCFSPYEATNLASFNRYFSVYICFSVVLILLLLFRLCVISRKIISLSSFTIMLIAIFLLSNNNHKKLVNNSHTSTKVGDVDKYYPIKEKLNFLNNTSKNKILIISDEYLELQLNYYYLNNSFTRIDIENQGAVSGFQKEHLNNYDYVFVHKYNDDFYRVWNLCTDSELKEMTLYKIVNNKIQIVD